MLKVRKVDELHEERGTRRGHWGWREDLRQAEERGLIEASKAGRGGVLLESQHSGSRGIAGLKTAGAA